MALRDGLRRTWRPLRISDVRQSRSDRRWVDRSDDGLTLVELLVAFTALIVLLTIMGNVLTTYLNAGTAVTSSYAATDQLLPTSMTIQRLLRSEVEPAPTLATTVTGVGAGYCANPTANTPCPPFDPSLIGTYSNTFYANIGDANGPAKIVMTETTPTKCPGCKFPSAQFTVTQYKANASTCPFANPSTSPTAPTNVCSWSASGTRLVTINNVVNGLTLNSGGTAVLSATPIFTYNTLDLNPAEDVPPLPPVYAPGATTQTGSTTGTPPTGLLSAFSTCAAPNTFDAYGNPTKSNCPADIIQSIRVDLQVQVQGSPLQENSFLVYRLSSASASYSPLVG
jgi:hypothetical protein